MSTPPKKGLLERATYAGCGILVFGTAGFTVWLIAAMFVVWMAQ